MPRSTLVEELPLPELQAFRPEVVVIPVGSTEQQAHYLPYGTDTCVRRTWRRLDVAVSAGPWYHEARHEVALPVLGDDHVEVVNPMRRDRPNRGARDVRPLAGTHDDDEKK